MMRQIRRQGNHLTISQDLPDGAFESRLYYWDGYEWSPPLPDDVEIPMERSSLGSSREIERLVGTATLAERPRRPAWQIGPDPRSYKDVQLLERYVDYSVSLGSTARERILAEIKRVHRAAGQAVEAGGWLFGWRRPRADGNWSEVALATRSTERTGTRGEVYLSDPYDAVAEVRAAYPRMELLGDWHAHTVYGSELPSLADAKAWAGTMDKLARDAFLSLIVSPSRELGWTIPKFSAWIAGRHGSPSTPMVGRARID